MKIGKNVGKNEVSKVFLNFWSYDFRSKQIQRASN